ncbi:hypothetical protein KP509_1Z072300 [Ceratopteris richardii]|nr:hypothetical protein KP509_1Z093400 [Ceratopteris richardii]KAH6558248.1 hypothetical protein KP509_1Z072300 [Ceratopteris richardii]
MYRKLSEVGETVESGDCCTSQKRERESTCLRWHSRIQREIERGERTGALASTFQTEVDDFSDYMK